MKTAAAYERSRGRKVPRKKFERRRRNMSEEEKKALENAEAQQDGNGEGAKGENFIGASTIGFDPWGHVIGDPGFKDAPGRRH